MDGILWTIETLHFIIHNHYEEPPCHRVKCLGLFFRIIDCCNMLRGFFMFLIFICKKSFWTKVKRFWFLKFRSPSPTPIKMDTFS